MDRKQSLAAQQQYFVFFFYFEELKTFQVRNDSQYFFFVEFIILSYIKIGYLE